MTEILSHAKKLDQAGLQLPVQCSFKHLRANGGHSELYLRRVKEGNETAAHEEDETGFAAHVKGKFSTAQSLWAAVQSTIEIHNDYSWIEDSISSIFKQIALISTQSPQLWHLFATKGKIEIYGPHTPPFRAQYISANYTMKIHHTQLETDPSLLIGLLAQHLDYPFAAGERRFSTSRLFDLCFLLDKYCAATGMAAAIDKELYEKAVYQPARATTDEWSQIQTLLDGESASIRTSYERVLQRERFAALIHHYYGQKRLDMPILQYFMKLVEIDLKAHEMNHYKNYPEKAMDHIAQTMHIPLALILTKAGKHGTVRNSG